MGVVEDDPPDVGYANAEIKIGGSEIMKNLHMVQDRNNLDRSQLGGHAGRVTLPELEVEMETGTGKTFICNSSHPLYKLDAIDAFDQKLVKKIEPICIDVTNRSGHTPYVYLSEGRRGDNRQGSAGGQGLKTPPGELFPCRDSLVALIGKIRDPNLTKKMIGRQPRTLEPNANIKKSEFVELWNRINHKTVYTVKFDFAEQAKKARGEAE